MKHATSRELYAYWDRVRRGQPAPTRAEIEPSDIRQILADTFILEVQGRDRYQIRLAGTRICSAYCREIKNTEFLDLWRPADRNAIATLATAVFEDAAGAVVTIDAHTTRNKVLVCELLLLPLRHNAETCNRILGSFATIERPYWLGSEPIVGQEISSLRLIWPDAQPQFMRRKADRGESSANVVPLPFLATSQRRRGHLTVLDGGKD
jgi:hypothetical protein